MRNWQPWLTTLLFAHERTQWTHTVAEQRESGLAQLWPRANNTHMYIQWHGHPIPATLTIAQHWPRSVDEILPAYRPHSWRKNYTFGPGTNTIYSVGKNNPTPCVRTQPMALNHGQMKCRFQAQFPVNFSNNKCLCEIKLCHCLLHTVVSENSLYSHWKR